MSRIWIPAMVIMVIIAAALIAAPEPTGAQTLPDTATSGQTPPEASTEVLEGPQIRLQPGVATDVPLNEPVAVDLGSLSVTGVSPELTDGVTVKAFTRHVEYEGNRIGQVVLTGVEKNGTRESLPSGLLNAQFDLTEPRLEAGREIVVEGDSAPLIAALEKLAEAGGPKGAEEQPAEVARDTPVASGQNSGGGESNDLAGSYQTPEAVKVTPPAKSVEGINVTEAGCTVRIDFAQEKAFRQNRTVTIKDGIEVDRSDCSDDISNTWPLKKSYPSCPDDEVDAEELTATAQFLWYYIDAGGARQTVSECQKDTEKVFGITEKACPVFLDYANLQAVPQASLVYLNDSNVEVQHRGCEASATQAAVPMAPTTALCTIRHDFSTDRSYQLGTHTYELDGIPYNAGSCSDNGTEYAHVTKYTDDFGNFICPVVPNTGTATAILQSRVEITVDGLDQFITNCTPDTTASNLVPTRNGCENPFEWEHDLAAGVSYGEHKFLLSFDGRQNPVTDCIRDGTTYNHDVAATGWQNHDDELFAYQLSTVSITPPGGRYTIVASEVLSGAAQMPYVLAGSEVRETGTVAYEGCSKYSDTATMQLWRRPDNSIHEKPLGPAARRGPLEACTSVATRNWPKISQTPAHQNVCWYTGTGCGKGTFGQTCTKRGYLWSRTATYRGSRVVTREDGQEIVNQTQSRSLTASTGCGSGSPAPGLPASAGVAQSTRWNIDLGWTGNQ